MPGVLNYKRDRLPPGAVYIGRLMPRYGLPGSKWHNPYKVGRDGTREEVIAKYERHLHDSGLIDAMHELRGRDLVCWCAPEPCHGDLLLRLANAAELQLPLTNRPPGGRFTTRVRLPDHKPTGGLRVDRGRERGVINF